MGVTQASLGEPRAWSLWESLVPGATVFIYPFSAKAWGPGHAAGFFPLRFPRETAVAGAWQPDLFLTDAKVRGIQILAGSQAGLQRDP